MARTKIRSADIEPLDFPLLNYKESKATIKALTGLTGGEEAYATDTGEIGHYDAVSAQWKWRNASNIVPIQRGYFL